MLKILGIRLDPDVRKPMSLLYVALVVSRFGFGAYFIAATWWLTELRGVEAVATFMIAISLPGVAVSLLAGGSIDRGNRRSIVVGCELAQALAFGILLMLLMIGFRPDWTLYAVGFLWACAREVFVVAHRVFVRDIVSDSNLLAANAGVVTLSQVASASGAAIGGYIAMWSPAMVIGLYIATLIVSAVVNGTIPIQRSKAPLICAAKPRTRIHEAFGDAAIGARFLVHHPQAAAAYATALIILSCVPVLNVLLATFVQSHIGGDGGAYGLVDASFGVGGLAATLILPRIAGRFEMRYSLFFMLALAASLAGFSLCRSLSIGVALYASIGLFFGVWVTFITLGQKLTHPAMQGRVMAVFETGYSIVSLSMLLGVGSVVRLAGPPAVYLSYAAILTLAGSIWAVYAWTGRTQPAVPAENGGR